MNGHYTLYIYPLLHEEGISIVPKHFQDLPSGTLNTEVVTNFSDGIVPSWLRANYDISSDRESWSAIRIPCPPIMCLLVPEELLSACPESPAVMAAWTFDE
ncbi:hypothetical protein CEXT_647571 [Caerostris extrusa]|uniref:Uncharacterized protein n=1 Tax=Caerostris extrusa TaxID=172846 RepID=A0AAV4XZR4_CAEEX|nr:hypothetical protein CEXT_647571 [Caerostris extrusa]